MFVSFIRNLQSFLQKVAKCEGCSCTTLLITLFPTISPGNDWSAPCRVLPKWNHRVYTL